MTDSLSRTRKLTIIAQDPGIKGFDERILKTQIEIPAEELADGPRGHRVIVVDYDSSTGVLYTPKNYPGPTDDGQYSDPFEKIAKRDDGDALLMKDPRFHCQNVYAIVMRTLARFEFALGRRVGWGFAGHQIHIAPHAFADANAFYSENDRALCFGYFPATDPKSDEPKMIFACLSHDVVAHETTHALLDGLRQRFTDPSSPDQAGFHEGFADVVAMLSIFSLKDVVSSLLPLVEKVAQEKEDIAEAKNKIEDQDANDKEKTDCDELEKTEREAIKDFVTQKVKVKKEDRFTISKKSLEAGNLRDSVLFGLAEQMGEGLSGVRGSALRRSVTLLERKDCSKLYLEDAEFKEAHRRGELVVAAIMNSFLEVWLARLKPYLQDREDNAPIDKRLVVEEGASAANHLLNMCIRALDYTPPTDLRFGDYLSAILTADSEVVPDDSKYGYRKILLQNFQALGIDPSSLPNSDTWMPVKDKDRYNYDRTHFESLANDPDEVFRFIWDNRGLLKIEEDAYTEVQSVRPSQRVGPDGFVLRETVATYVQMMTLRVGELGMIPTPKSMPDDQEVTLYGGGTLIFNEYGKLKFHISNNIFNDVQSERLDHLWSMGYIKDEDYRENLFARMHLQKTLGVTKRRREQF